MKRERWREWHTRGRSPRGARTWWSWWRLVRPLAVNGFLCDATWSEWKVDTWTSTKQTQPQVVTQPCNSACLWAQGCIIWSSWIRSFLNGTGDGKSTYLGLPQPPIAMDFCAPWYRYQYRFLSMSPLPKHPFSWRYIFLRICAVLLRSIATPTQRLRAQKLKIHQGVIFKNITVPSRDKGRHIQVHIYQPASYDPTKPTPVLIHWHGLVKHSELYKPRCWRYGNYRLL